MKRSVVFPVISIGFLTVLGACGGGGDSDAFSDVTFVPYDSNDTLPADGAVSIDGNAVQMDVRATGTSGRVNAFDRTPSQSPSNLQLLQEGGSIRALKVTDVRREVYADRNEGDEINDSGALVSARAGATSAVITSPTGYNLKHQVFGAWATGLGSPSGSVGAGSYGNRTAATDVPVGTNATYEGESMGYAVRSNGRAGVTVSTVEVTTDFNTVDIESRGTITFPLGATRGSSAPELDFSGSGSVNGSTFNASVAGSSVSGNAQGRFYGPNAAEAGGTFSTSGGGANHVGAFGATKVSP